MSFKLPPSPTCGRHWFKITSGRNIFCCHTCIASEFLLREGEEWLWLIQDSTFRAFATEGSATASLPGGLPAPNHACGRFLDSVSSDEEARGELGQGLAHCPPASEVVEMDGIQS